MILLQKLADEKLGTERSGVICWLICKRVEASVADGFECKAHLPGLIAVSFWVASSTLDADEANKVFGGQQTA